MKWDELVAAVGRFGLSNREAALYLGLLRRGSATAAELAREVALDRVVGYQLLDSMRVRGVVEATADRPRRYRPTAPDTLFEQTLEERRESLREDERIARALSRRLTVRDVPALTGASRYQVLSGTARAYERLAEMIRHARRELAVMLTQRSLRESVRFGFPDRVQGFLEARGKFRLILESEPRPAPLVLKAEVALRPFARAQVRHLARQPTRMTIVDRSEALMFLVPELRDAATEHVALWTDFAGFVAGQSAYFESVWRSANRPVRG
jgi:sugar-specific transcriptional regulator TrmB